MEKMRANLEDIFRCDDQSALVHNCVTSQDPPPGAWSHHSAPQSPLGKVSFPEMLGGEALAIVQGQVYTRAARTVTRDLWIAQLRLRKSQPTLLLMELRGAMVLDVGFRRGDHGLRFLWDKPFMIDLSFTPKPESLDLSDDPASLKRKFGGADDVKLND